jgi:general stress protein CsbA
MKLFNDLISDNTNKSSTRFVYVTGHVVILALSIYLIITDSVNTMNLSLLSIIIGTLNSTKLIQKSQEIKIEQNKEELK